MVWAAHAAKPIAGRRIKLEVVSRAATRLTLVWAFRQDAKLVMGSHVDDTRGRKLALGECSGFGQAYLVIGHASVDPSYRLAR